MSAVSEAEVKAEKDRLVEARNIAESEKRLYVKVLCARISLLIFALNLPIKSRFDQILCHF